MEKEQCLRKIYVSEKKLSYSSYEGVLYSKNKRKIIRVPKQMQGFFVVPDTVEVICAGAFENCVNLKKINIPSSVKIIGDSAFLGCSRLEKVKISNGITSIGSYAFKRCYSLRKIEIPHSVTSLAPSAFEECINLRRAEIYANTKTIPDRCFSGCSNLNSILFSYSINSIGEWAFADCLELANLNIPNTVMHIQWGAFAGCIKLQNMHLPDNGIIVEDEAFLGCKNLNVVVPPSVTMIGRGSFAGCKMVTIPSRVIEIGNCLSGGSVYMHTKKNRELFLQYLGCDSCEYTQDIPINRSVSYYQNREGRIYRKIGGEWYVFVPQDKEYPWRHILMNDPSKSDCPIYRISKEKMQQSVGDFLLSCLSLESLLKEIDAVQLILDSEDMESNECYVHLQTLLGGHDASPLEIIDMQETGVLPYEMSVWHIFVWLSYLRKCNCRTLLEVLLRLKKLHGIYLSKM